MPNTAGAVFVIPSAPADRDGPSSGRLTIERVRTGTSVALRLEGELDIATAPRLRSMLAEEQGAGAELIVVDLERVTFMDSSGLHALIDGHRRDDGRLRIALGPAAAAIIEICDLRGTLPVISG